MSSPEFYRSIDFFPVFDEAACAMCLDCLRACGLGAIELAPGQGTRKKRLQARHRVCRNCRSCVQACRRQAVKISAEMGGTTAGHLKKDLK